MIDLLFFCPNNTEIKKLTFKILYISTGREYTNYRERVHKLPGERTHKKIK